MKMNTIGNDVQIMARTYKMVLNGLPEEILKMAAEDIITGKAEGLSLTFMPTTAELRQYCDKLTNRARLCVKHAQRLIDAPEELGCSKRVSRERMAALMDGLGNAPANQTRH